MHLDSFTIKNLELFQSSSLVNKKATLIDVIDKTRTSAGSRMLRSYLKSPLLDQKKIQIRQNRISEIIKDTKLREALSDLLKDLHPGITVEQADTIAEIATKRLNQNGLLYFEIHEQKGSEILEMLKDKGFTSVELKQDLQGKDRMVKAKWKL